MVMDSKKLHDALDKVQDARHEMMSAQIRYRERMMELVRAVIDTPLADQVLTVNERRLRAMLQRTM